MINQKSVITILLLLSMMTIIVLNVQHVQARPLAAIISVTTTTDESDGSCADGDCSLRDAINTASAGDTIVLQAGQTYNLTIPSGGESDFTGFNGAIGDLDITQALTIQGNGATINSFGISNRVFHVSGTGNLTISELTLTGGQTPLTGSFFVDGIGIYNRFGTINVSNTTFIGTLTHGVGGGITFEGGTGTIANSTFANNRADFGGGIAVAGGATGVQVINSTFSGNIAVDGFSTGSGGGIYTQDDLTVIHSTFVNNTVDGSGGSAIIQDFVNTVTASNNLFAGNQAPTTSGTVNQTTSYDNGTTVPVWLGPLQDNGGSTQTHALLAGAAPAINQGSGSEGIDQRGYFRDASPDIGAFEFGGVAPTSNLAVDKSVAPATAMPGDLITYTLAFSNAGMSVATGVVLTDTVPVTITNLNIISAGVTITDLGPPQCCAWQIQDLASSQGGTITITGQISPALSSATTFTNTATITTTAPDSSPANNTASVSLMVTLPPPALTVTKIDAPDPAAAGTSLVYTITIANQSVLTVNNITLSDTLSLSSTISTADQTDNANDPLGFGGGTGSNIVWVDPRPGVGGDAWLQMASPVLGTGVFTSRVMDGGAPSAAWTDLIWRPRRPSWKPLPDNGQAETAYTFGNVNMVGNRLLLHLDGSFIDSSGQSNDGVCTNCPATGAAGRYNSAVSFDGVDDEITVTDASDPVRYAFEMWVYPTAVSTTSLLLRRDPISGTATFVTFSHLIGIAGDKFVHQVQAGGTHTVIGTTSINPNTWYHVVGTAESGGDMKLYVNGVEEGRLDGLGPLSAAGEAYHLSSPVGLAGGSFFQGRMDEVAVYSRTLSAAEINDRYLRGALRLRFNARSCALSDCSDGSFGGDISEQSNNGLGLPSASLMGLNRYFQYRAILEADDGINSPQLMRVQVLPDHRLVQSNQGSCSVNSGDFGCTLGSLAAGESITLTLQADIDPSALGTITNTALVTASNALTQTAQATTTIISQSDLRIFKEDEWNQFDYDPVNPGFPISYSLQIYNAGPSTAWDVTVTDTLPISPSGLITPTGWSCQTLGAAITCTAASLSRFNWQEIIVRGTAPSGEGLITNTAWISSATGIVTPTNQLSDTEPTLITFLADLSVSKVPNVDPVEPGLPFTYTVTVTNSGPYTASSVIVTDTLPGGLTGTGSGSGWTCGTTLNAIVCTLPILSPSQSASFSLTVTAPFSGVIANQAEVSSSTVDPDLTNNIYYLYTQVRRAADLAISKHSQAQTVVAGQPLTYTLIVTNSGPLASGEMTSSVAAGFNNAINIPIGGMGQPYGAPLAINGVNGLIRNMTVTVRSLSHTYPADIALLLVGPGGQRVVLMANAGGGIDVAGVDLTFNQAGPAMPANGPLVSTVYRPTNLGLGNDLPVPAPAGPYGGSLTAFYGSSPNGVWRLYGYDVFPSDGGVIAGGWSLELAAVTTDTLTLTDTLPSALSGVSFMEPAGWQCSNINNLFSCDSTQLAANSPVTFTIQASTPLSNTVITNTAWITGTVLDPDLISNTASVTTAIVLETDLSIRKTSLSPAQVFGGQPITYTVTITNPGPAPVNAVLIDTYNGSMITGVSTAIGGASGSCGGPPSPIVCTFTGFSGTAVITFVFSTDVALSGVLSNSAVITAAGTVDLDPSNNQSGPITTTVLSTPTAPAQVTIIGPTAGLTNSGYNFTAVVSPTSTTLPLNFFWQATDFGGGLITNVNILSTTVGYSWATTGSKIITATALNSAGSAFATHVIDITEPAAPVPTTLYLPVVLKNFVVAPDLVVQNLIANSGGITVVIENQGPAPIAAGDGFWVNVYVNPNPPPAQVNDVWYDGRSVEGLEWGVDGPILGQLTSGGVITSTIGDVYNVIGTNTFTGLTPGDIVYAHVDAVDLDTTYGGVLENHEIVGLPYNNIAQTTATAATVRSFADLWANLTSDQLLTDSLPARPSPEFHPR